ncbi:autotransporter domain-containing protein [Aestuariivirga sp. YIM B02566]|uniref:Autotransporter domain-containing protein n=1 Tax=Taklimakanibacter albus TaxID=2800327 RepID=A0ACC5RFF4_9HYPH|nr:autotransporter domain-containing protein [Aestuariivirga sp. YIM B02566]MBK1871426.1 autotransporter domain-containing protein [Aestuariivirga sp. YIM B02566]
MVRWLKAAWNICAQFQGKAHAVALALPAILILLSPIAAKAADGDGCNYLRNNLTFYDNANYNVSSTGPTTIINQAPFGPQTGITNFAAGTVVYYEYTVSSSAVNARLNRAPLAGVATVFVDTNISGSGSITLPVATRSMAASAYVPGAGSGTVTWTIYCGVRATQAVASTSGTVGTALSFTPVTATFGRGTHSYALSGGTLPAGLSFNTGTGAITGTPTAALAATTFTVTVTHQGTGSDSKTFELAVNASAPTIAAAFSPTSIVTGGSSTLTVTISNPNAGMQLTGVAVSASALPAGLTGSSPTTTCTGGTATLAGGALSLSGATLNASASCTVSITASSATPGNYSYTSGTVSATGPAPVSGSTATTPTPLTVTAPAPTVTSVAPASGPTAGGTSVIVTGANFTGTTGPGAVRFGGTNAATYTVDSDTQITAVAPAHAAGVVDVTITAPGGTSATSAADQFTYVAAPVASSFTASALAYDVSGATFSVAGHATNSPTSYAVGSATTAQGGSVSADAAGLVTYSAPVGFRGNDSFTFTATNLGGTSSPATVTVPISNPVLVSVFPVGSGQRGIALSGVQINTTGGRSPHSCSTTLNTGALPAGTQLNSDCTITGTPAASGIFTFTANVTDSSLGTGPFTQATGPLVLTISAPTITLSPAAGALPGGSAGAAYSQSFTAGGGTAPYSYAQTLGTLPTGMTLTGGTLSGTPTTTGTFNFDITATDSSTVGSGGPYTRVQSYSITVVQGDQTINFGALPNASLSASPLTLSATASSGLTVGFASSTPSICTVSGTTLTLLQTGTCSITASQAGDTDWNAASDVVQSFTVTPANLVLSTGGVSGNQVGASYSQSNTASGGIAPYTYALNAGAFVPGTSLDSSTGLVSGTPTIAGTFSYQVRVTDSQGTPVTTIGSITTTTIAKGDQTASFTSTAPSSAAVGGSAYTVTATATSGLGVVFSPDGASTGCAVTGNSVTFTSTGTCQINANQPGDTNWNAAPQVQQSFTVGPAAAISASVTFAPATVSAGDTGAVTITFTNTNASNSPAFNALLTSPSLVERVIGAPGGTCSIGSTSIPTATTVQFTNIVVAPGNCTITLDYTGATAGSTSGFTLGAFTPGGYPTTSATAGNAFTVAPTVTGVSPPSGPVSQVVTVSGTGFSTTPGDNIVMFGAVAGSVTAASATSLTVTAPATGSGAATVTVTVNGQTSTGSATYTFIDKPVAADRPGVVVAFNSPGTAIDLSGSISGGPHSSISIGTAPANGTTSIAGDVVTYTPATGYSGPDSFTYTATGAGGTSNPGTVSIQVTVAVPTASPLSINALAGRTVTVDLTGGAAGGPFTGGALVSITPADAADVELIEGGTAMNRTYSLQFTSRTNTEQAVTVLYTLSNAGGTSAPLTLTIQVGARSDPSDDPEVRGLEAAETGAARRTAATQIRNFGRRMEQLHDGRCTQGMGARLSLGIPMSDDAAPQQQVDDDPTQPERIDSADGTASDSPPAMAGADSQDPAVNCDLRDPGNIELWTDGTVTIGSRDATGGVNGFDFSTSGLSAGADIVLAPGVTFGIGVGVGRDQTDVGDNGSEVEASSWAVGAYGSFRPVEDAFIDVLAGVGGIDFDLTRYVTDTGGSATAERKADLLFGSVRAGIDRNDGPLRWSLFGGIEASRTSFDSYVEDGPESYSLAYDEREMDTISGLLGGRFEYSFLAGHTILTPRGRFEYRYDFEQAEGQRVRFSDWLTGPSYLIEADGWSRSQVAVEVGIGAAFPTGWQLGADVTGDLSGNSRSMGLRLEVSRGF